MKVAIVGCGAVGSYYGALLCRSGQELHFLLRSDYEAVRRRGVSIRSPSGNFCVRPRCATQPAEIGPCDLVLVTLKTTANDQLPKLVLPLVGPTTAVLTLQNGLGNEEALAQFLPAEQILGGLCFVCLNRLEPGLIRHTDHGRVVIGEFQRQPSSRTHAFAAMFRNAAVPCDVSDDLVRAHWEKLVWNIPFNGLGVAGLAGFEAVMRGQLPADRTQWAGNCLATDVLLSDPRWQSLVKELMFEIIAAANARGVAVAATHADTLLALTRTMGAYRASTLLDFERGRPLELESLFLEPLRQAQQARVAVPRLEALCRILRSLDSARARAALRFGKDAVGNEKCLDQ